METFYFGDSSKLLFGAYHPANGQKDRNVGIIICNPIINEYLRCHRAFVRLASLLAAEGFHVLRFDYYGCGDSLGESEEGSLSEWISDISTAINELKNGTGVSHICLIGLRMGASMSLLAAENRNDIDAIILWESIVNGDEYIQELNKLHLERAKSKGYRSQVNKNAGKHKHREILGFPITDLLLKELQDIDLLSLKENPANKLLLLSNCDDYDRRDLSNHLKTLDADIDEMDISSSRIWLEGDNEAYTGLVPAPLLQNIVTWVSERYA